MSLPVVALCSPPCRLVLVTVACPSVLDGNSNSWWCEPVVAVKSERWIDDDGRECSNDSLLVLTEGIHLSAIGDLWKERLGLVEMEVVLCPWSPEEDEARLLETAEALGRVLEARIKLKAEATPR